MTDNKDLYPEQQPEPAAQTPAPPADSTQAAPEPQAAQPSDSPDLSGRPVPQLTLEPDPAPPTISFPNPPAAPEPPPEPVVQQQGNVQYSQYSYTGQQIPQDQPFPQQQPYSGQETGYQPPQYSNQNNGYQAPNFTAQSYQQPVQPQQPKYTTPPAGYAQKSRLAAGLLAVILGGLGIHNFYMGINTRGTIQLVLCLAGGLLTCGVASVAAIVWGFIEGVMLLSSNGPKFDGNGVIMKD